VVVVVSKDPSRRKTTAPRDGKTSAAPPEATIAVKPSRPRSTTPAFFVFHEGGLLLLLGDSIIIPEGTTRSFLSCVVVPGGTAVSSSSIVGC
jgi:hypothetical protein